MKHYLYGLLTAFALVGLVGGAYMYGLSQRSTPPQLKTETTVLPTTAIPPTVEPMPTEDVAASIKQALIKKNNWKNGEDLIITVKTNDGTYASGGIQEKNAEAGGGYFFAVKDNGTWVIVADGNGTMSCANLAPYPNYPTFLIPECWDEKTNTLIKR